MSAGRIRAAIMVPSDHALDGTMNRFESDTVSENTTAEIAMQDILGYYSKDYRKVSPHKRRTGIINMHPIM